FSIDDCRLEKVQSSVFNRQSTISDRQSESRAPSPEPRTLRLPVPTRDAKLLLKLWLLHLKSEPPPAPVLKVALAAEPAPPRVAQGGLFLPLSPDPEKLEVTLARIAGVVGKGKVGRPELVDTHRPDAFRMEQFAPEARGQGLRAGVRGSGVSKIEDGRLKIADWKPSIADPGSARRNPSPESRVTVESKGQRTTDNGQQTGLYRIYQDLGSGSWFIRGIYD